MTRRISHDGRGSLEVRFPFDRELVDLVKTLPSRRWNANDRFWAVPDTEVVPLVDLLLPEGFGLDDATRRLYLAMGGSRELPSTARVESAPNVLPGLFDDPPSEAGPTAADADDPPERSTDLSVSELNETVRRAIRSVFPSTVWLIGEISGFDKSAHRRHVSFELVERAEDGRVLSKIPAVLFGQTRREIVERLRQAGDPMRLEDEVSVRLRVSVDLYVAWGQYRVVVEELDVRYTLGEAARRREEIIRRLVAAGLTERNTALPLPDLPLRVGLVTSLGSDAFNDVIRTLQESGYAFDVVAHGARVQGASTESSVLNALDVFRERADLDVVLICRGGGARTDLVWFDSERLGAAVAGFPVPVIVGIGHEQDRSVLDAVARSCKTPTAAAALLVERVARSEERIDTLARSILTGAAERIVDGGRTVSDRATRLTRAANALLRHESSALEHRQRRAALGARAAVGAARDRLARWTALIPRDARVLLERRALWLAGAARTVRQTVGHELASAGERLTRAASAIGPATRRGVARERERLELRARRLRLVDPRRVLERGYAILRNDEGTVVTRAVEAPAGVGLRAELREGRLRMRSEGSEADGDG